MGTLSEQSDAPSGAYVTGAGSPEGVVTASPGVVYQDTTNGLLYVKNTGTGNTGWRSVPFGDQVALVDELVASTVFTTGTVSSSNWYPIFVAPFPLSIVAASVIFGGPSTGIVANDTNYVTVTLRRVRSGTDVVIATKTTQATGGQTMPARGDWNFDAVAFDANNKVFAKGDICAVQFGFTGAPAGVEKPMATVRYVPT